MNGKASTKLSKSDRVLIRLAQMEKRYETMLRTNELQINLLQTLLLSVSNQCATIISQEDFNKLYDEFTGKPSFMPLGMIKDSFGPNYYAVIEFNKTNIFKIAHESSELAREMLAKVVAARTEAMQKIEDEKVAGTSKEE